MIFQANSQDKLEKSRELQPNAIVFFISLLSQVLFGCLSLFFKQQYSKNDQIQILKDLTRLLKLVKK